MAILEELKRLSDERFLALYRSLSDKGFGPLDGEVAKALKFRPHAIRKLPMETRAKRGRLILSSKSNAELCYDFFGTYLVKTRNELVTAFLDATGVAHDEGMIEDAEGAKPDTAKIPAAVGSLDESFDPEDVTLYLALCTFQWPDVPEFEKLWRERTGQGVGS